MNSELMLRVADAVEAENVRGHRVTLNMVCWHGPWYESCGTTACIGGFVDLLLEEDKDVRRFHDDSSILYRAQEALGLEFREARQLMTDQDLYGFINRNRAIVPDALRWMAATGRVNWQAALRAAACVDKNKEKTA